MTRFDTTKKKIVATVGLFALAIGLVGFGAFATFTDTESVSQSVSSGTVNLDPVSGNAVNNRLSVGASNIAAGDTIQRTVLVKNSGTIDLASTNGIVLTTSATTSSLLDTNTSNGLQMDIAVCSVAWSETGGPPYTYTCSGSQSSVVASTPVIGTVDLSSGINLTAGANNYLRVTLTLPSAAPNALQAQSSVINYSFVATQRTGQAQ